MKTNKRKKQYIDNNNKRLKGHVFGLNIRKLKDIAKGSKACKV